MTEAEKIARSVVARMAAEAQSKAVRAVDWSADVSDLLIMVAARGHLETDQEPARLCEFSEAGASWHIAYDYTVTPLTGREVDYEITGATIYVSTLAGTLCLDLDDTSDLPSHIYAAIKHDDLEHYWAVRDTYASMMHRPHP